MSNNEQIVVHIETNHITDLYLDFLQANHEEYSLIPFKIGGKIGTLYSILLFPSFLLPLTMYLLTALKSFPGNRTIYYK